MKILSNSQVAKTLPVSSNSMSGEDRSDAARRLSPSWNGTDAADRSLHRSKSDPLDRHINIATNKLQLGCRIRQNEKKFDSDGRFADFVDDFRRVSADCLNGGWVEEDLCGRLSESLMCSENGYRHNCLENGYRSSNAENGCLLPPLLWHRGDGMPSLSQIREYRKSLSVRLGSLKWSLDLVMVVKSRSTPKPRLADKPGGKSSSRARKLFSTGGKEKILRTQSCNDILRVSGDYA